MEDLSKYWKFFKINSAGNIQFETIADAQAYFQSEFGNFDETVGITDSAIVRQLWQQHMLYQSSDSLGNSGKVNSYKCGAAELCLRCYISGLITWVCSDLGVRFGTENGFSCKDLLPFVLDDEVLLQSSRQTSYQSLATLIIQTFDPTKGSLKTWVNRYVKQHPEIHRFLLEHGIFLISDWALLNDTNPKELQRIETRMYQSASLEIQQSSQLLISYHAVYREDRLQQRLRGKTLPCQPPTSEQLMRIVQDLQARTNYKLSSEAVLSQLQAIAAKLRQYRIAAKGGLISTVSINQPEVKSVVESSLANQTDRDTEQLEFIKLYQKEFRDSLDLAISQTIEDFISRFKRKSSLKSAAFIKGLYLFHCQGKSMSQIAPEIGLKKQYEVTRLLKFKELSTDIRQRLLSILGERVIDTAEHFTNTSSLKSLEKQVELILDEQISDIIQEAESEVKSPVRNHPLRNLIARRICSYLDKRNTTAVNIF
ncbi:hypothetical protein Riv7116_5174 [Rivularia sp. PCC 7116]|uniref:hypothetical protein n=1 Tax=Rivularia sp. PCC 7116 TaxID=373994 RepID=UPI00029F3F86|nr:hypothetical protein [Rivularia sp. PCC 7116]AFY57570.1 hypothetical protein Riv7116_5174 [Rivularia sp. PCC 7116]